MVGAIQACVTTHVAAWFRPGAHVSVSAGGRRRNTLTDLATLPSGVTTHFVVSDLTQALMMSTGSGNTIVVFFSTPISVSVCR